MSPAVAALVVLASALLEADALHAIRQQAIDQACAEAPDLDFPAYVSKHGRTYKDDPAEYALRAELFAKRAGAVKEHNCAAKRPLWVARVNHLADWTDAELESLKGLRIPARDPRMNPQSRLAQPTAASLKDLPTTISYKNLTAIQAHRDQGRCGSCWAFAAERAMRARAELAGLPHKFSVGQVVACAPNPHMCGGSGGCHGATTELAYEYALQAGLVQEDALKYPAGGGQPHCPSDMATDGSAAQSSKAQTTAGGFEEHSPGDMALSLRRGRSMGMIGWTKLPENRLEPILRALVDSGPLTVSVAASRWWHVYDEGIMPGSDCDENNVIGHAVVLYGIGQEEVPDTGTVKYWSLKNSWGSGWGEGGSIRIVREENEESVCGWDNKPEVGSGCLGGPDKVWVCGSCGILYNSAMPLFEKGTKT